jgi:hypothetical protein
VLKPRPRRGTMTTTDRMARGSVLQIDTGRDAEAVKVKSCTGVGPFQVTVRPVTWLDRAGWWLMRWPRRLRRRVRDWWLDRCCNRWCLRRYAVVDAECDGWCWAHADEALTEWMETTPGEGGDA